ncbi:hypothetical protein LTR78_010607 [Recurvomyces mirabilis]|uniref:Uncharacterized protein n=1 Tax=Recurvomyces mirabilis TaxID=574656 RepID=A0AAE0TPF8_9PEZI|nr:hypothetical protein LTR78_010607 [Recurvomyces mirabilis]
MASTFHNIDPASNNSNSNRKTKLRPSAIDVDEPPPCKILKLASNHVDSRSASELTPDEAQDTIGIEPQVLVFRYRGHGWAFDLHTGLSDRGSYQLGVWQTEIRHDDDRQEEVWVRRGKKP